jgi:hypothetical protein
VAVARGDRVPRRPRLRPEEARADPKRARRLAGRARVGGHLPEALSRRRGGEGLQARRVGDAARQQGRARHGPARPRLLRPEAPAVGGLPPFGDRPRTGTSGRRPRSWPSTSAGCASRSSPGSPGPPCSTTAARSSRATAGAPAFTRR